MVQVPNEDFAVRRARWLAEVAEALDDARLLVKALGAEQGRIEAVELYAQIEAARLQVRAMRVRRSHGVNSNPEWMNDIPWKRSA